MHVLLIFLPSLKSHCSSIVYSAIYWVVVVKLAERARVGWGSTLALKESGFIKKFEHLAKCGLYKGIQLTAWIIIMSSQLGANDLYPIVH